MSYDGYAKYDAGVAGSYDHDREGEAHWQAEQAFLASYASQNRLGRVLDIPVGTGRFFEFYSSAQEVVGADVSPHMLQMARQKASGMSVPGLDLAECDATDLPYSDGAFDTVICFRLAHLLPPDVVPKLIGELARVSNGTLVLQAYTVRESKARREGSLYAVARTLRRLIRPRKTKPWSHIASYPHTSRFLTDTAISKGFKLVKSSNLGRYENGIVEVFEFKKCEK